MNKLSMKPCPICKKMGYIVGENKKGEKLASCGHAFSFKKTRSEKLMDKKYVQTPWGLELAETIKENK